jgi:mannose-6-phosphate isomerase-like protein (cupin superfamily)
MSREVMGWNKPVFRQQLAPTVVREVYIAPETCPTERLSVWLVRGRIPEEGSEEGGFDTHPGMEEALYLVKGRIRLRTPNESVVLERGGSGWIPAGMPHRAESVEESSAGKALEDEVIILAAFAPARSGRDLSVEENSECQ